MNFELKKPKIHIAKLLLRGIAMLMICNVIVPAQVSVSLPTLTRVQDSAPEWINVTVGNLTGQNVSAFQFTLSYNKSVIFIDSAISGTLISGGSFDFYADTAYQQIRVSFASSNTLSGSGTIVQLKVHYINSGTSQLAFNGTFEFNNGIPAASITEGSITLNNPIVLPQAPTLVSPAYGSTVDGIDVSYYWNASSGATEYWIQIAMDTSFTNLIIDQALEYSNVTVSSSNNGSKYYWRVKAGNSAGWGGYSGTWSFINGQLPIALTLAATNITSTSSILNGSVNSNNSILIVQFDYGTTTSYGTTVTASQSPVTSSTTVTVSANLSGLTSNTLYHFRVKATNTTGTTYGADSTFTTLSSIYKWQAISPSGQSVSSLVLSPNGGGETNIYAGTDNGNFLFSTNYGTSWTVIDSALKNYWVTSVVVCTAGTSSIANATNLFAGTFTNGIFSSTNNGLDWTEINSGLPTYSEVHSLAVIPTGGNGTNLFAGTWNGGVFLSTNNGASWSTVNTGLTYTYIISLFVNGSNLYAGTWKGGVYLSKNNGANWVPAGLTNTTFVESFTSIGTNLFAGTLNKGIFVSNNNGMSWTPVNNGLTDTAVTSLAVSYNVSGAGGAILFAGTENRGVFLSTDNGLNWTTFNTGLSNYTITSLVVSPDSSNLFAVAGTGRIYMISISNLRNTTAVTSNSATNITSTTATLNGIVYPNGLSTIVQFDYGTNTGYGNTVTASQSPVTGSSNVSVSANLTGLAANTLYHFRVKATNSNGITYGPDSTFSTIKRGDIDGNTSNGPDAYSASLVLKYLAGLDTLNAQQLAVAEVDGNTGLTANDAYWILYATAYGSFPDGSVPKAEGPSTGAISAGQLCSQENSNLVTIPIILQKSHGIHACFIELNINKSFADVENVAANIPRDWLMVHNYVNGVLKIAMAGVTPLTDGNLAMISLNLKDKNAGFSINGSAKLNANLKQAINNFTVQAVPNQFGLSQNYPNPFNPSTKIKYQLARDSHVSLTVYDILGQKVRTLINELQQAGYYNITWDGNNDAGNKAASGIYIYRLQSGNFIKTLKMNLLK